MISIARHIRLAALTLGTVALAACNGSVTVNLTDTPVDNATSVIIDFTGMELHSTGGQTVTINFPSARQINLLQLQNGLTAALLQDESVPSGSYDWIQLNVLATQNTQGQSYITLNTGAQYPLYVPSGSQSALRITTGFSVPQSGSRRLIIEFDLRQSITSTDGQNYTLVPALRLTDQDQAGTITANMNLGALAAQQLGSGSQASQCSGALFVFSGASATPQNGGGSSLIAFKPMGSFGATTQASSASFPYLPKGSYTVAATCDYGLYDPAAVPGQSSYQALHWAVQSNVSVIANKTTTVSLPSGTTSNSVH